MDTGSGQKRRPAPAGPAPAIDKKTAYVTISAITDMVKELENIFEALAEGNRLRILKMLEAGPACVCELEAVLKIVQSAVSEHLKILKDAGLISNRHNGFFTDYFLEPKNNFVKKIIKNLLRQLGQDGEIKKDLQKIKKINRKNICCTKGKNKNC